ncbi:MAG: sulfite oxidase-like oxidoreductase [Firmicutes bacterium]|nr:sulfite oxidase-like oxidoreductase [Bacillota bacterium]
MTGHEASAGSEGGPEPRIPPGQVVTPGFPVLHHGRTPSINLDKWIFRITGLVEESRSLNWEEFRRLPAVTATSDIHCVTRWSKLDNRWEGVAASEVLKLARPRPQARFVLVHAEGGWTTNLPLEDLAGEGVLFAFKHNGADLSPDHGWPLRLVVPHLYFWKSAKWVNGLEFMAKDRPGFWEQNGYHMRGDPWQEERFQ